MPEVGYTHPLFIIDRFVDLSFICDCFINTNLIYYGAHPRARLPTHQIAA